MNLQQLIQVQELETWPPDFITLILHKNQILPYKSTLPLNLYAPPDLSAFLHSYIATIAKIQLSKILVRMTFISPYSPKFPLPQFYAICYMMSLLVLRRYNSALCLIKNLQNWMCVHIEYSYSLGHHYSHTTHPQILTPYPKT